MKLFGNHKKPDSEEMIPENKPVVVPAPVAENPGKLVLDIEGALEEPVKEEPITLKAPTSELPVQATAELADRMAGEQIVLKTETDELPIKQIEELTERLVEEPAAEAPVEESAPEELPREEAAPEAEAPAESPEEGAGEQPAEETDEAAAEAPAEEDGEAEPETAVDGTEEAAKEPVEEEPADKPLDDEALLAELYALIGDPDKKTKPAPVTPVPSSDPAAQNRAIPRPVTRITPEALQAAPEEYEELQEDDSVGVPGWLKGVFILLISLLLSAMSIYAVASDVIGEIF